MLYIKKYLRTLPTIVIYLAVVVSFLNNFIDITGLVSANFIGYSVSFNLVIIYFLWKLKYCIHTIMGMINLTVLNIFNILNSYNIIDYATYYITYDTLTLVIMFLSIFVYSASRK